MANLRSLPTGRQKVQMVTQMFDTIAPRYDLVNRVMTLGMDRAWRRRTADELELPAGSVVADIACGTGDLCIELRKRRFRAIGFDLSAGMLSAARTTAPLVLADALRLPLKDGSIDGLTCGFALRNVTDLTLLFQEAARVLRPGGRISLLEVSEPDNRLLRKGHHIYFNNVVPLIGGLLSDREAYRYLPRSAAYLPEPQVLAGLLSSAGFEEVRRVVVGLGAAQILSGTRA